MWSVVKLDIVFYRILPRGSETATVCLEQDENTRAAVAISGWKNLKAFAIWLRWNAPDEERRERLKLRNDILARRNLCLHYDAESLKVFQRIWTLLFRRPVYLDYRKRRNGSPYGRGDSFNPLQYVERTASFSKEASKLMQWEIRCYLLCYLKLAVRRICNVRMFV